ncbi:MAG: hypothetical protein MRZ79_04720 [Bacteroidia bacterium]|nr:hypothetical protein [Bacteroidia bacterium]
MIRKGARGNQVKVIQMYLNLMLPSSEQLAVDGIFGDKTDAALRQVEGRSQVDNIRYNRMQQVVKANISQSSNSESSTNSFSNDFPPKPKGGFAGKIGMILFGLSLSGLGIALILNSQTVNGQAD